MRRVVTLYEFMPYGAPELLESRQRHMGRALMLTSALALIVCALAGGIALLIPVSRVEPRHIVVRPETFVIPQEHVEVMRPDRGAIAVPEVHEAARPVPVRDDIAPPSDLPGPTPDRTGETGTGVAITPGEQSATGSVTEFLPARGDYVYVETLPAPVREVKPEYPTIALDARVEGRVTVHVLVGNEGRVFDAVLAARVQVPMLNEAALAAARQWVFTPGLANGKPVACWTAIPFHFVLN